MRRLLVPGAAGPAVLAVGPAVLAAGLAVLAAGCSDKGSAYLEREEHFNISVGMMEDEMILFQRENVPFSHTNSIYMRDGRFFIGNGNASKVMEFSSYGDILALHYNARLNPDPVVLSPAGRDGRSSNRLAWKYPFQQIGDVAVNSRSEMLVVDRIPEGRRITDEDQGILLDRIIHRFSSSGEYRDFLGQEGVGGTPFPFIDSLHLTSRDEIVVVCRLEKDWRVYWFSRRGDLLYQVNLPRSKWPLPADLKEQEAASSLQTVRPDQDRRMLYLKMVFYIPLKDQKTGVQSGIDYAGSRIARLDVTEGAYQGWIEVPSNRITREGSGLFEEAFMEYPYQLIGTASGGHLFLIGSREEDFHQLLVLDREGRIVERRELFIEDSQLISRDFHVSSRGILTALLNHPAGGRVVWWRIDRLLETDPPPAGGLGP